MGNKDEKMASPESTLRKKRKSLTEHSALLIKSATKQMQDLVASWHRSLLDFI